MMADPAADLPDDPMAIRLLEGTLVTRVHQKSLGPVWFGPGDGNRGTGRFDAPHGEFGTLYVAHSLTGAFVETILRRANRIVGRQFIDQRAWSVMRLRRDCNITLLHGQGLVYHGVTSDICAGDNYAQSQELALALYQKYSLDGLAYRARHNNDQICYALNDRVQPGDLAAIETHQFADNPKMVDELLRLHGAVCDPQWPLPQMSRLLR